MLGPLQTLSAALLVGKIQRVKTQRAKTSGNFAEEKIFAEDISEDFSDLTFARFYSISGYLRNLRGRLLSSEKFSEVFTLSVFTLKPFPGWNEKSCRYKPCPSFDGRIFIRIWR